MVTRTLHDLGDLKANRPVDLKVTYSQHYCSHCDIYFNADMDDLAWPKARYTHRVVSMAVRVVNEDGLPYRTASWHLWWDHRVFVPFATIQNWVEAGGKRQSSTWPRTIWTRPWQTSAGTSPLMNSTTDPSASCRLSTTARSAV